MAMETGSNIRIALIESDPLRLIGLRSILTSEADFEILAHTLATVQRERDGLIILLGARSNQDVCAGIVELQRGIPQARIIVTGSSGEDEEILQAITAGAKGYVHEAAAPAEFKQAIRAVHGNLIWAPRRVLSMFVDRSTVTQGSAPSPSPTFTERELDVLRLLVEGCTNREIGIALGIEIRTVKAHVARLMNKTGAKNRIKLSVCVIQRSLLPTQNGSL